MKVFGDVATAQEANGKLTLTQQAQDRLAKLKGHVSTDPSTWKYRLGQRGEALYQQHLQSIDVKETDLKKTPATTPQGILSSYLKTKYSLDDTKAGAVYRNIEKFAANIPLTITVPGMDWFGKTQDVNTKSFFGKQKTKTKYLYPGKVKASDTVFDPATQTAKSKKVSELFGKDDAAGDIEYTGKFENPNFVQELGENYLRFRKWKDTRQTRRLGFEAEEMPTFGAANVNWNVNRGTSSASSENLKK